MNKPMKTGKTSKNHVNGSLGKVADHIKAGIKMLNQRYFISYSLILFFRCH